MITPYNTLLTVTSALRVDAFVAVVENPPLVPKETDAGSYTNSRFPQIVLSPLWRDVKGLRLPNSGLYRYSTTYTQRERVGASSDDYRNGASYCAMNCLLFISPRRSCYGSVKSQWPPPQ